MARNFVAASSQYLSNANAILGVTPLTLAAWLNASATGTTQYVLCIGHLTQGRAFGIGVNSGNAIFAQAKQNGVSNSATTTGTISASTWHHACGVFAGDAERYAYLDGGSKASNTTSRVPGDMNTTMIGARADNGPSNYFSGNLGEAAMWDAALTDAEVAVLALGISPLFVRPGNLVAYWPLIGRTSPEIDPVGGFDMTLNATPVVAVHPRIYMPQPGLIIPGAGGGAPPPAVQQQLMMLGVGA